MRVVIGGAGVAALEAAAALRRLAAGRVSVTLVAPDRTFRTRALQPFAAFGIDSPRGVAVHALADRLEAQLIEDRVAWVDRHRYTVHCRSGRPIAFEALVLGVGATLHVRYPRALALHEAAGAGLTQLVSDITSADVRRVAFVTPERMAWPLPLYETALMTAALGRMHQLRLSLTLVTGEAAPLQVFGDRASAELRSLLDRHDIELLTARRCQVPAADRVVVLGERGGEDGSSRSTEWWRSPSWSAPTSAASPPPPTASSRSITSAGSPVSAGSTPRATAPTTPSSTARSPPSKRRSPRAASRPRPGRHRAASRFTPRSGACSSPAARPAT